MSEPNPAGPEDLEALLSLMEPFYLEQAYPFDREAASAALRPILDDGTLGRVWLFRDGGKPVGYFVLTLGWSLEHRGRDAFVDELYLSPSHRGRGLGTRALGALDEACRALGVRALHLEVERGNPRALELYRRWGFFENDRLLMTKKIDEPG